MSVTHDEDVIIRGMLVPSSIILPPNSINASSQIQADSNLDADKLEQRLHPSWQQANAAAVTETRTLFVARRAGTLNEVVAGSIAKAVGDAITTIDVKKNGTTVLSAVITLDSTNTNRVVEAGAISGSGDFVAGDWFEVVITATIGTGTLPTGVFCQIEVDHDGT